VDYWATYVTKQAKAHGLVPFCVDRFYIDRANNVVKDNLAFGCHYSGSIEVK
jgi:hypothetical protein